MIKKYTILDNGIIQSENQDGSVSFIPTDPSNSDYQAYLAHLTESVTKAK